ncbi:MAG: TlpA disulfide reductase family protein [Pyrinomonadaceae bacterium]
MKTVFALALLLLCFIPLAAQTDPNRPTFVESTMDGTRVDIEKLRGKVVVLNLWFINCPNCIEEIKLLNALVDEYKGNSDVVFLAPAASKKAELQKFLAKNPFKYQVIPDAAITILSKFGKPDKDGNLSVPFPMHFVLDREGKIVVKEQGIKGVEKVKAELRRQFSAKTAAKP